MILAKNYFDISSKLYSLLFEKTNYNYIKQAEIFFGTHIHGLSNGFSYVYLNYYYFNILLQQTKEQNTIFHSLDDNFFNELSVHKNKILFFGLLGDKKDCFTLTKIIYLHPNKKFGIYVRKKITSKFFEKGLPIQLDKKQKDDNITIFVVQ